ncbi:MAG: twin-arginine translocation signal domain-containing protein [Gemmatimonadetes bacterium]|nr:twin-arginine translocation signal domain-containing protein [Gemmatimonadota bacterium]
MSTNRRSFLKTVSAAGAALGVAALPDIARGDAPPVEAPRPPRHVERAPASLEILILGGTGFTGPEQVEYATARGHKVTLFNRNKTRPDFFKGRVEQIIGDLGGDVSGLAGKQFDVVIDNPTTLPFWVRNAAQQLAGHTKHYIFISTLSVYPDNSHPWADESDGTTPLPEGLDPYTRSMDDARKYYGALKTFSEHEVEKHYPGINTIIRPGLIVGPLDRSDRFTYWPVRIDKGGEVLAPGHPEDPAQIIDSRDLAEWMIRMAEGRVFGTYNAPGPDKPLTMAELLYGIKAVTTAGAQFTWVPADFLKEHGVNGWRHMPVWVPPVGATAGFTRRSNVKAVAKGLTFRPLAVTAKDTLDWHKTRPAAEQKTLDDGAIAGIPTSKETEVLAAWHAKQKGA